MSQRAAPLAGGLFFLLTAGLLYFFARDQFLTHIVLADSPRYARPLWHIGFFFIPLSLFNAGLSFLAGRFVCRSRRAVEIDLFSPSLVNDFTRGARAYVSSVTLSTCQLGYIFLALTVIVSVVYAGRPAGIFRIKDLFALILAGFALWCQVTALIVRLVMARRAGSRIFRRPDRFGEVFRGPVLAVFIFFNLALAALLVAYLRAPGRWPL